MASATKTTRGFDLACPYCGADDAALTLDVTELKTLSCGNCDEEFTPRQAVARAAERLREWERLARWVEMAADVTAEA